MSDRISSSFTRSGAVPRRISRRALSKPRASTRLVRSDDAGGLRPHMTFVNGADLLVRADDAEAAREVLDLPPHGPGRSRDLNVCSVASPITTASRIDSMPATVLYSYDGVRETLRHFLGDAPAAVLEVGCGTGHWLAALTRRPSVCSPASIRRRRCSRAHATRLRTRGSSGRARRICRGATRRSIASSASTRSITSPIGTASSRKRAACSSRAAGC